MTAPDFAALVTSCLRGRFSLTWHTYADRHWHFTIGEQGISSRAYTVKDGTDEEVRAQVEGIALTLI